LDPGPWIPNRNTRQETVTGGDPSVFKKQSEETKRANEGKKQNES
jgi:hypothetical protein